VLHQFRDGGDLEDFRRKWERSGKSVSETFVWHVLGSLVSVIAFCTQDGATRRSVSMQPWKPWKAVCHRDVTALNIFLDYSKYLSNEFPDVLLGGFGMANFADESEEDISINVFQIG
jgi:serine/threonine protein kinase